MNVPFCAKMSKNYPEFFIKITHEIIIKFQHCLLLELTFCIIQSSWCRINVVHNYAELQIRRSTEDNSKIIFLISQ